MTDTVATPLRLHHVIAIAGTTSVIPAVVRVPDHPVTGPHAIETLRQQAARRGGFLTTVYAPDTASARKSVRTHANAAYAALNSKAIDIPKTNKLRAVVFSATSFDTGELDVRTIIDEPTCMHGTRTFMDYLKFLGLDRYVIEAPTDAAALSAAWELFMDDVYTDDVYAVHATV
ncbi:hypothetical protein [Streptomyces sp. NPDC058751]|uniref:hypothetical protein n=1 Tax=Streptomyces sp. NPDC058751 TaxID=3346623 RepID=UPI0036A92334